MINDCCVLPLTFSEWKHSLIGSCFYLPVWWAEGQASVFAGRSRELLFFRGTQGREEPRQDLIKLEPQSTLNECPGCVPCGRERAWMWATNGKEGTKGLFDYQCPCIPSLFWPVRLTRTMWLFLDSGQGRVWSPPLLGWSLEEKFQDRLSLFIPQGHWQLHLGVIVQPLDGNSWIAESLPGKQLQTLHERKINFNILSQNEYCVWLFA